MPKKQHPKINLRHCLIETVQQPMFGRSWLVHKGREIVGSIYITNYWVTIFVGAAMLAQYEVPECDDDKEVLIALDKIVDFYRKYEDRYGVRF